MFSAAGTHGTSQDNLDNFWKSLRTPTGGARTSAVLPLAFTTSKLPKPLPARTSSSENALASYELAVESCKIKVAKIVKECRRINQKYSDPHFDLEDFEDSIRKLFAPEKPQESSDEEVEPVTLRFGRNDRATLIGQIVLPPDAPSTSGRPQSVKRIGDIFDDPSFYVDGTSAKDIQQGFDGDCWFLSSLAALCTFVEHKQLIEDVCVARDEEVGVYGFVFHRDGEWRSEIIDDKLYLKKPDYDDSEGAERQLWEDARIRVNSEEEYRRVFQTNSGALWYAHCSHPNETWVPLIEKAYAKAHNDYESIEGGWTGEGIEDLTGGVATKVYTTDILDKNRFWKESLLKVGKEFLFGCETGYHLNSSEDSRQGLYDNHAYSILDAKDIDGQRLLKVKNPWGRTEWKGPWSDGSSEWTAEWIQKLGHTFGDDGIFWISYKDLLRKYRCIHQTRLFDKSWNVARLWANVQVPWAGDYHDTKFEFTLPEKALTVIVLSQLDSRYFKGLQGQYIFKISFRLHEKGEEDYLVRTLGDQWARRSTSVELELEPGTYTVVMKLEAWRNERADKIEDVVSGNWLDRREKLLSVGLSYDFAHAKGRYEEEVKPEVKEKKSSKSKKEKTQLDEKDDSKQEEEVKKEEPEKDTKSDNLKASDEPEKVKEREPEKISESAPTHDLDQQPGSAPQQIEKPDEKEPPQPAELVSPLEPEHHHSPPASSSSSSDSDDDDYNDEVSDDTEEEDVDPWDATCLVGLRVYTRNVGSTLSLVIPKKSSDEEGTAKESDKSNTEETEAQKDTAETAEQKQLDIDHPAKDEAAEPEAAET